MRTDPLTLADSPVGGVHRGGPDRDAQLPGTRTRHLAVDEIEQSPDLSARAQLLELRCASALAAAIRAAPDLTASEVASTPLARFAVAAFTVARQPTDPDATLEESVRMLDGASGVIERVPHDRLPTVALSLHQPVAPPRRPGP